MSNPSGKQSGEKSHEEARIDHGVDETFPRAIRLPWAAQRASIQIDRPSRAKGDRVRTAVAATTPKMRAPSAVRPTRARTATAV